MVRAPAVVQVTVAVLNPFPPEVMVPPVETAQTYDDMPDSVR